MFLYFNYFFINRFYFVFSCVVLFLVSPLMHEIESGINLGHREVRCIYFMAFNRHRWWMFDLIRFGCIPIKNSLSLNGQDRTSYLYIILLFINQANVFELRKDLFISWLLYWFLDLYLVFLNKSSMLLGISRWHSV